MATDLILLIATVTWCSLLYQWLYWDKLGEEEDDD